MSDSGMFLDEAMHEKTEAPNRFERALKWSVIALGFALAAEAVWFLAIVPCLPLRTVEIVGAESLPPGTVGAAAGLNEKTSFLTFDAHAARRALEALPEVESATITRLFPDGIRIDVATRKTVAVALASDAEGRSRPVSIDRNGVVFRIGNPTVSDPYSGPVISGLVFENPHPGVRLPSFLLTLVSDLSRIRAENPALLDAVSEIRVVKKAYDAYELVLYPTFRPVRVRIGSRLNEDVLRYMMLLLDVLAAKGVDTDELDFRTGTAAYRVKEG